MKIKTILAALTLWLTLTACGDQSEELNQGSDSEVASLIGGCDEYGIPNMSPELFVCTPVNVGNKLINVLWRLDGFTIAHRKVIRSGIILAMQRYSDYWRAPAGSPLLACIVRNATEQLDPRGSTLSTGFKTTEKKAIWAITTLQFGFQFHVDTHQPIVVSGIGVPLRADGSGVVAQATVGNDKIPTNRVMNFEMNRKALDISSNAALFAGAIVHEMLHTRGYDHISVGRSVGPLVYEFGNCVEDVNTTSLKLVGKKGPAFDL